MITVHIKKNDAKRYLRLKVSGHAGQADIGKDIVCSSASILAYTVAQIVKDMESEGKLANEPVIILKDANATITCVCKNDEAYSEAFSAYNVANVGYSLLAHNYPQYVELQTVGKVAMT